MQQADKFYTPAELAEALKLNKITIYRKIKAKELKAYKIGKEFRIDQEEFNKFLEKSKTK
jgi:excisionase family DNA binding protein